MKEIKSYYNHLSSKENVDEDWEIKIVEESPGRFYGGANAFEQNLSVPWNLLSATTEEEAFNELVEKTKINHH